MLMAQSVNDAGSISGTPFVMSPEVSQDYRIRAGIDTMLDYECFNYTNQRTNKHFYAITTLTMALAANGLMTNALGVTTQNTGVYFRTHRYFPLFTASSTFCEFNASLSLIPAANTVINFGLFQRVPPTFMHLLMVVDLDTHLLV